MENKAYKAMIREFKSDLLYYGIKDTMYCLSRIGRRRCMRSIRNSRKSRVRGSHETLYEAAKMERDFWAK